MNSSKQTSPIVTSLLIGAMQTRGQLNREIGPGAGPALMGHWIKALLNRCVHPHHVLACQLLSRSKGQYDDLHITRPMPDGFRVLIYKSAWTLFKHETPRPRFYVARFMPRKDEQLGPDWYDDLGYRLEESFDTMPKARKKVAEILRAYHGDRTFEPGNVCPFCEMGILPGEVVTTDFPIDNGEQIPAKIAHQECTDEAMVNMVEGVR